ncbi:Uncharacterised protein [Mycobacterium tuberculosis]|uniref:Uncharacterized protein n=1 Tax=Mycobacterium tuberculosis TaxID=1773 RepID=A0A654U7Z2_MYCTX|nr:Uncharacterised protein [Mycobacterium tuberculosis]CKQ82477.1 Uncharacterised protein [Mycobacterium tuberculosis]COZ22497.1 Uncharacterised protein [Mycobacterium tuberculosis]
MRQLFFCKHISDGRARLSPYPIGEVSGAWIRV